MPTATAEVISIGDELTSGARLDTNTQWLSQRLGELGVSVRFQTTVGDLLEEHIEVLRIATARADLVVTSGGLGPTADDLTRDALAAVSGKPLVQSDAALAHIESLFTRRGRTMPPRNQVQAMFPEGAAEIFNPRGTAPGIDLLVPSESGRRSRIFALPGVPDEMKEMFVETVMPRIIAQIAGRKVMKQAVIKCFGLGESDFEARLGEMISRLRFPRVGITVSAATISLRIATEAETEAECDAMIETTRQEILQRVGPYVFGEGEDFELQHALAGLLEQRGERLATIELGHAAPLAGWLADIVPREAYAGGLVTAAIETTAAALRPRLAALQADWLLVVDRYPTLQCGDDAASELTLTLCGRQPQQFWQQPCSLGGHPGILHARIGKAALAFARSVLQTTPLPPATAVD